MELEIIVISEAHQAQKDKSLTFFFICALSMNIYYVENMIAIEGLSGRDEGEEREGKKMMDVGIMQKSIVPMYEGGTRQVKTAEK
jgi:hypothetical protein